MASFAVRTPQRNYTATVERGVLARIAEFLPKVKGRIFVVTTPDVWELHGAAVARGLDQHSHIVLFFPGGEERKRLASVEALAEKMMDQGGDRSSLVIAFGGGIVNDVGGFLASVFMRGIPVLQIPTTLLAQVDAAVGGKTGVNLVAGKNLVGTFHQPLAVLVDPEVLTTLPEREYRAGLWEILKTGIIRSPRLFEVLEQRAADVFARVPAVVDDIVAESVRIKAEVVTADEKESDLRRILNFGHTFGHTLEAETAYARFLHGEAVAWGMHAAVELARRTGHVAEADAHRMLDLIRRYGPIPALDGIPAENLAARLRSDKKTIRGSVHFVLPARVGETAIVADPDPALVLRAIQVALDGF